MCEEVVERSDVISKQSSKEEDSNVVGLGCWRDDSAFHLNSSNRKANQLVYGRFYRRCVVSLAPSTQKWLGRERGPCVPSFSAQPKSQKQVNPQHSSRLAFWSLVSLSTSSPPPSLLFTLSQQYPAPTPSGRCRIHSLHSVAKERRPGPAEPIVLQSQHP